MSAGETWSHPLSSSSSREREVRAYARVFPLARRARFASLGSPPSIMKTSTNDGSPMADCNLKTAIFRTESSSLPSRCTRSGILMLSIVGETGDAVAIEDWTRVEHCVRRSFDGNCKRSFQEGVGVFFRDSPGVPGLALDDSAPFANRDRAFAGGVPPRRSELWHVDVADRPRMIVVAESFSNCRLKGNGAKDSMLIGRENVKKHPNYRQETSSSTRRERRKDQLASTSTAAT